MPRDPLARFRRDVERKTALLLATRREDYPTLRGFRVALNRRANGVKRAVSALCERIARVVTK